jgi:CO dehydrogenase/acetyl-CoA synthase beta subunit
LSKKDHRSPRRKDAGAREVEAAEDEEEEKEEEEAADAREAEGDAVLLLQLLLLPLLRRQGSFGVRARMRRSRFVGA